MSVQPDPSVDPDIFMEQVAQLIRDEQVCSCVEESTNPSDWHHGCRSAEFAAQIVVEQAERYLNYEDY